ncbi:aspartate aminotransferase family protein [Helicobacter sp. MIT 03-1614]|jgi:acetylornithine aminotransferase|uniref:Acetylornithine aminotransferase n=1 Tax=Helicobacter hepaticus (strain ATCC 51449 / 3B1) TaxID=235279 RepID=Q7VHJ8_HELHP|nr:MULTISPECIES: aspartate aminotransferase family protein [Helicobacter]AAP77566.1 acetylornithine aminotransferase [Helicobacter hepaticus ATCC 51449]TLD90344.1 aspartate aminotransferase family protein [Helicobacter sp. MIT 03-1614]
MDFTHTQALDEEFVLHTYARANVAFVRGENARIFDTQGNDYIDFGAGIGVCSVGHANAKLAQTIYKQAQTLLHTSNLYYIQPQARLAQEIITLYRYNTPYTAPMRAFFCNSGAEANECAIKIARKYGKPRNAYKIITLDSSFHGRTIASLKATAQEKMHQHFGPFPDGFVYAKNLDDVIAKIDDSTCAVLLELVQGEGGVLPMDKEKINTLSTILKQKQILLMVDEVQSGVFRSGEIFASKVYEIDPDVITTAKGLAGGVPIGAVLTKLTDIFEYGDHGSTFGGNFLSCAAGLETLAILNELYNNGTLQRTITLFHAELDALVVDFADIFSHKVGLGLMCGLYTRNPDMQQEIIAQALKHYVIVLKSGKGVVRFLPPLTITQEEIKEGFARVRNALKTL